MCSTLVIDYSILFPLQDWFQYFLVYDPQQKTLVADRGEMGIGTAYQAQVPKTAQKGTCMVYPCCSFVCFWKRQPKQNFCVPKNILPNVTPG